jgi:hypothetical protein
LAEGRPLAEQLSINPDRPDSFAFVAKAGALMAAFSPQKRANYFRGNASK